MAQLKLELQEALRDKAALARLNDELLARVSPTSFLMRCTLYYQLMIFSCVLQRETLREGLAALSPAADRSVSNVSSLSSDPALASAAGPSSHA